MNQYEEQQTAFDIDGYYILRPDQPTRKTPELAFDAAKLELIAALRRRIEMVEQFDFKKWFEMKKKGI
jgi:hypothetical protein